MNIRKWLIGIALVLLAGILAAVIAAYVNMRAQGLFRDPVYETVAPELPPLSRPAILVFSKTNGFIHKEGIPAAKAMLQAMAARKGWSVYLSDNGAVHNPEQLARFDAIVWNNVSGDVLTPEQREAFIGYLENGGGYVGIHASGGDNEYAWQWYVDTVLRAQFIGHPMNPQFQSAVLRIENADDPIVSHLPDPWRRTDEWYSFADSPRGRGSEILATLDESSYSPSLFGRDLSMGEDHPVIWKHCVGRGRVFYSALGHTPESYAEPEYIELLKHAIAWAAGLEGAGCR